MEEIKLILDSSSNQETNPAKNTQIVPLTISFNGKEYRDDQNLNIKDFLEDMSNNNVAAKVRAQAFKNG